MTPDEDRRTGDVRISTLENRYEHLDAKVSSISEDVAAVKSGFSAMNVTMTRIADVVNRPDPPPPPTNWTGIIGALCTTLVLLAGFVQLRVAPIETLTTSILERQIALADTSQVTAHDSGVLEADLRNLAARTTHMDERFHVQEVIVAELRDDAAAARVSRRAIGDYVKELAATCK